MNPLPRESTSCPEHPQSVLWWREIPGYKGEHASRGVCGRVSDSHVRYSIEGTPREPVTIRSFSVYREHAAMTDKPRSWTYYSGSLCEEAGEVWGVLKKWHAHGHEFAREKLVKELGDCLWYLDRLAATFGITLEEVATANAEKLAKRYPNGYSDEKSRNRDESETKA